MRPNILNHLFRSIEVIDGVGAKAKSYLEKISITRIKDAIFHLPVSVIDRRYMPNLYDLSCENKYITALVTVDRYGESGGWKKSKRPFIVHCSNKTGCLDLIYFSAKSEYIKKQLPIGATRVVSGKVAVFDGQLQISHPDYVTIEGDLERIKRLEAVYGLTYGITNRKMRKIIYDSLVKSPELTEWICNDFINKNEWLNWNSSCFRLHYPKEVHDIELTSKYRNRLAYDELLANQLALALTRKAVRKKAGCVTSGDGDMRKKLQNSLNFELTNGQNQVLEDIFTDMGSNSRMLRLLQGDVGSGKTVVALMAMLNAAESGVQAVLMAPTDILSRQHYSWISQVISGAGLENCGKIVILTGKDSGKRRKEKLQEIKSGGASLIIGTHALFQESVEFKNLGLVVIDEQHRFGVKQRLSLAEKGDKADILLMTATPIPRTLTLTFYGDMEVSQLKEKPAGRVPIDTRIVPLAKVSSVIDGLKRAIEGGDQVYWVCPLIDAEENEGDDFSVENRFKILKKAFANNVAIIHGRMKSDEKLQIMEDFKFGKVKILVATTVIEVGVDVKNATIMIVEKAEQFGLSQLHQLRGRVGRNSGKSSCVLLYGSSLTTSGKKRLQIMRETEDGFRIAEEDFLIRGAGDVLGVKQSGLPEFKIAILPDHSELLLAARNDVKSLMSNDSALSTKRGESLKTLLYLFEYDEHIKYLDA